MERPPDNREPFGFVDGISQPWIERVQPREATRIGGGKLARRRRTWQPLAIGEFVLGEVDEGADVSEGPAPEGLFRHGSFLVVRKLHQDVTRFNEWVEKLQGRHGLEEGAFVGRRRDGTPLATTVVGGDARNGFTFSDDPEGYVCPLTAHIRRVNPRDSLGFDGVPTNRHRMIRRGMPYAEAGERGLVFMALVARLDSQFELVQQQWLNDANPFRIGSGPDVIAGSWSGSRDAVVHSRRGPTVVRLDEPFVQTRGGDYFFVPAIAGLWAISQCPARQESSASACEPEGRRTTTAGMTGTVAG